MEIPLGDCSLLIVGDRRRSSCRRRFRARGPARARYLAGAYERVRPRDSCPPRAVAKLLPRGVL